jgi:hypothetical protein
MFQPSVYYPSDYDNANGKGTFSLGVNRTYCLGLNIVNWAGALRDKRLCTNRFSRCLICRTDSLAGMRLVFGG